MLEYLAQDLMQWPEFTAQDAVFSAGVLLVISLVIAAVRFYARRKGREDAAWNILRAHALRRGLDFREIALLNSFFRAAGRVDEILLEPRTLYKNLRDYLTSHHEISDRTAVRVIDKLFPSSGREVEVLSPTNLRAGEFCGVEYGRFHYLGRIVKTRDSDILISLTDWKPATAKVDEPVFIYVFRGGLGGYLLHGRVVRLQRDGMIVRFMDKVETLGERHLMMQMRLPLKLYEWPPAGPHEEQTGATPANGAAAKPEPLVLQGWTDKISDRALTLTLEGQLPERAEILRHDLWRLDFELTSGFRMVCRARLQPLPGDAERFLLRYLDPSDNARHALFADIREHGGERENLY